MTFDKATSSPQGTEPAAWPRCGKRVFDLVFGFLIFLLALPFLLIISLLIKLFDGGSVFFFQDRAGKGGEIFQPWKFRTMRAGRRPDPKELVPLHHADITLVGRFLRRFKIDELPQIINVLKGDMSLVGPRPTLPDQVAAYDTFRRQRLLVKPGLTG
ncbi:MAG: sugar transferase, partial [Planctomycetota bacterium]